MITIQKYDKETQKLNLVTDMSFSLANAIRRSALEIPIMAIDEVEIFKNDSALYDEIIAHRMGLIPIQTEKTSKEVKFKVTGKGPKTIYSTDLVPEIGTQFKIPIVILDEGQELEIVADAKLGKGVDHIKYSPGLIYFRHNIEPEVLDFVHVDDGGKVSFNEEELGTKEIPAEIKNKIKGLKEVKELVFEIESWGQIDVKDIFIKSISALDNNLKELAKAVK